MHAPSGDSGTGSPLREGEPDPSTSAKTLPFLVDVRTYPRSLVIFSITRLKNFDLHIPSFDFLLKTTQWITTTTLFGLLGDRF